MRVVAHRGYSSRFPENTAIAFKGAVTAGADLVETDLRLSRDGAVVCSHDPDLGRVSGVGIRISDATLAELKAVALPGNQTIPTLEEVLEIAHGKASVMLDAKVDSDALRETIMRTLRRTGMEQDIVYGVRSAAHLRTLREGNCGLALLAMPSQPHLLSDFLGPGLCGARLWEEDATKDAIGRIHSVGLQVWVTAGLRTLGEAAGQITRERLDRLISAGADAVLVNDVVLALASCRERRSMA